MLPIIGASLPGIAGMGWLGYNAYQMYKGMGKPGPSVANGTKGLGPKRYNPTDYGYRNLGDHSASGYGNAPDNDRTRQVYYTPTQFHNIQKRR
jgi:hypothetical protein